MMVTVGDRVFSIELEDNSFAAVFFEKVRTETVKLELHDYGKI